MLQARQAALRLARSASALPQPAGAGLHLVLVREFSASMARAGDGEKHKGGTTSAAAARRETAARSAMRREGIYATPSVVEEANNFRKMHRMDQASAMREARDGLQLFTASNHNRALRHLGIFLLPVGVGATFATARSFGMVSEVFTSWPVITALMGTAGVMWWLGSRVVRYTVRDMWLVDNGDAVRLRTYRLPWGSGPMHKFPTPDLIERVQERPDQYRYLGLKSEGDDGPCVMLHRDGEVPEGMAAEALESLLAGNGIPEHISTAMRERTEARLRQHLGESAEADPADAAADAAAADAASSGAASAEGTWRVAVDGKGRRYYWHEETRHTRWTRPKGPGVVVIEDEDAEAVGSPTQ